MISRTTVDSSSPFDLPRFDERPPAGEHARETELIASPHDRERHGREASVLIRPHARTSRPGLFGDLTVSLAERDDALARDKLIGKELADCLLEGLPADPLTAGHRP